jgi:hypothetical protein
MLPFLWSLHCVLVNCSGMAAATASSMTMRCITSLCSFDKAGVVAVLVFMVSTALVEALVKSSCTGAGGAGMIGVTVVVAASKKSVDVVVPSLLVDGGAICWSMVVYPTKTRSSTLPVLSVLSLQLSSW